MVTKEVRLMKGPQSDFFLSEAKYPGLFSGRRGGKTFASVAKAFAYCDKYPGAVGCMTAPTYNDCLTILVDTAKMQFGTTLGTVWEFKRGDMQILFANSSKIYLKPGEEPDKVRGLTLAFFAMDEIATEWQHETFRNLQPCLTQEGYPQQGWVTSTPDWQKQWIRRRWLEHVEPISGEPLPRGEYPALHAATKDNWHLPEGHFESLLASAGGESSRLARQELYGEFIMVEGAGFPQFRDSPTFVRTPPPDIAWRRMVAGLDFGGVQPTALIEVGLTSSGKRWATREFYKGDCTDEEWIKAVGEWGVKRVICDPSGGERKAQALRKMYGVPLKLAPSNRFDVRYRLVSNYLEVRSGEPGLLISPECRNLIAEIPNLGLAKPRGRDYYEERWLAGTSDHAYDALAYGLQDLEGHIGPVKLPRFVRNLS